MLGANLTLVDDAPLSQVLTTARAAGALAVIPWGLGKWMGKRGRIVRDLIEEQSNVNASEKIFLADCGTRPVGAPRSALLAAAEAAGLCVLAGSDPLPVARGEARAGAFGFLLDQRDTVDNEGGAGGFEGAQPFAALASALRARTTSTAAYGRLEGPFAFLGNQIAMQLRKRRKNG